MDDQELTAIVQRMIDAGESEENIATVIQGYPKQSAAPEREVPPTRDPSLSSVAIPAAVVANEARPVLNAVGSKVAKGAGSGVLRVAGRVAGGTVGSMIGGGLGLTGGPVTGFGGAGIGMSVGGSAGNSLGRKAGVPLRAAGKFVADATGTFKNPAVRGAMGRFTPGALPPGRALVNAFGKAVPGIADTGVLSTLIDQQGDGAGLPHDQSDNMNNPDVPWATKLNIHDILEARGQHAGLPQGQDTELPAQTAPSQQLPDLNTLSPEIRAQIIALLRGR